MTMGEMEAKLLELETDFETLIQYVGAMGHQFDHTLEEFTRAKRNSQSHTTTERGTVRSRRAKPAAMNAGTTE